jgi:HprK-related kinase A
LKVADFTQRALRRQLGRDGLRLRTGPIVTNIRTPLDTVAEDIALHYAEHFVAKASDFADFHVVVERPHNVRRWIAPQVVFRFDGLSTFAPLPGDQGFPMLEWGLNWCVTSHCHQFLIVHAAVLERGGRALILPAPSGSGKSTLCAALAFSGWRLLSDELALIAPEQGHLISLPRPIGLKNESIEAVRSCFPEAVFGRTVRETIKGSVVHVKPLADSVRRAAQPAVPAWVIAPRFLTGAEACLEPMPKARAMMCLVDNAFNYNVHGRAGFAALSRLVDRAECHRFTYSRIHEAVKVFEDLTATGIVQ